MAQIGTNLSAAPRRIPALALALIFAAVSPSAAQADGWADSLTQMTQLANAAQSGGNAAGAKAVILAGLPTFLSIMQQNALHIPKNRKAAEGFNAAAETIYKGHPVSDDAAAFAKVLATHGPTLLQHAEIMATPSGSARNQLAMLLRAQQSQEQLRQELIAYVTVAPNPAAHLKEQAAKDTLVALRTIVTGMTELAPRAKAVMTGAKDKGREVVGWAEGELGKDNLFPAMAHARRAAEIAEGMLAIDKVDPAAKDIGARAEKVKSTVAEKYAKRVAKNRFPAAGYKGSDAPALGKELLALYRKTYPKEGALKLVVLSTDWDVQVRSDWDKSRKQWTFTRYKMLDEVAVAVARKDGKRTRYWVNFMRAYKVWNGKTFGPTQLTPIGHFMPYEVLEEQTK